jgi:dATP pyrophosphohydrolase
MMLYKRPESVLVVVYTHRGGVLLLRRRRPPGFWQSVTGSMEWREASLDAARRELYEETGLAGEGMQDCQRSHFFEIFPIFRTLYPPGVTLNLEHVFCLGLSRAPPIMLDPREHDAYVWVEKPRALVLCSSYTNRDAIIACVPDGHARGAGCA